MHSNQNAPRTHDACSLLLWDLLCIIFRTHEVMQSYCMAGIEHDQFKESDSEMDGMDL